MHLAFRFAYPSRAKNVEAMVKDPASLSLTELVTCGLLIQIQLPIYSSVGDVVLFQDTPCQSRTRGLRWIGR